MPEALPVSAEKCGSPLKVSSVPNLFLHCDEVTVWKSYGNSGRHHCPSRSCASDFAPYVQLAWYDVESYKKKHKDCLTIRDEWICFDENSDFDAKQTSLYCLATIVILGDWTLSLRRAFEEECIQRISPKISTRCTPIVRARNAFEFAAANDLDKICSILWQVIGEQDRQVLADSCDVQVTKYVPNDSLDVEPPVKRPKSLADVKGSFVDVLELAKDTDSLSLESPTPMCAAAGWQATTIGVDTVTKETSDESSSEGDEFSNAQDL